MFFNHFKTYASYIIAIILLLYGGFEFFIKNEKWHLILISLVLYGLMALIYHFLLKKKINQFYLVSIFPFFYGFILAVFFSSSYLQTKAFQLTHPDWVQIKQVEITDTKIDYIYKRRPKMIGHTLTQAHV